MLILDTQLSGDRVIWKSVMMRETGSREKVALSHTELALLGTRLKYANAGHPLAVTLEA